MTNRFLARSASAHLVSLCILLIAGFAVQEKQQEPKKRQSEKQTQPQSNEAQPPTEATEPTEPTRVIATVGQHKITNAVVNRFIKSRFANHPLARKQDLTKVPELQAEALQHHVHRALAYHYLESKSAWVSDQQVKLELTKLETELSTVKKTIESYAREEGISREDVEFETAWRLSWERFLIKTLTEEKLKNFYANNRRRFDGTQLRVAHLLIKDETELEKAASLSQELIASPEQWNEQVAAHSDAPSKDEGGIVGWIGLDGPMPNSFARAAFELEKGQVSQPVKTKFGLHIIHCLEVKPGKFGLKDAYDQVYGAASKVVFDRLVALESKSRDVEYANDWPHFDTDGKMVAPKG